MRRMTIEDICRICLQFGTTELFLYFIPLGREFGCVDRLISWGVLGTQFLVGVLRAEYSIWIDILKS